MNKRQAKKYRKKVVPAFVDEMNLLTLNDEEYKEAMKNYRRTLIKCRHYKHYRDIEKIRQRPFYYSFPVGKAYQEWFEMILRTTRSNKPQVVTVHPDIRTLLQIYDNEEN